MQKVLYIQVDRLTQLKVMIQFEDPSSEKVMNYKLEYGQLVMDAKDILENHIRDMTVQEEILKINELRKYHFLGNA